MQKIFLPWALFLSIGFHSHPLHGLEYNPILPSVWIASFGPNICIRQKKEGVPFFIVNARLSDRSFSRLSSLGIFRNLLLPNNLRILASSEKQRQRWITIGLDEQRTCNTGNLKVDIAPHNPIIEAIKNQEKGRTWILRFIHRFSRDFHLARRRRIFITMPCRDSG